MSEFYSVICEHCGVENFQRRWEERENVSWRLPAKYIDLIDWYRLQMHVVWALQRSSDKEEKHHLLNALIWNYRYSTWVCVINSEFIRNECVQGSVEVWRSCFSVSVDAQNVYMKMWSLYTTLQRKDISQNSEIWLDEI